MGGGTRRCPESGWVSYPGGCGREQHGLNRADGESGHLGLLSDQCVWCAVPHIERETDVCASIHTSLHEGEVLGLIHTQSKSCFSWCQNSCNGTTPPGRVINCLKESRFSFPISSSNVFYPLISLDLVSIYLPDQRVSLDVWLVLTHNLPLRLYLKLVSLG